MRQVESFARYSRQIFIDEIGVEGQRKILETKVLVIGAGGLGSPVIQYLLGAGVGELLVLDADRVELHNLHRQCIHSTDQVGKSKVSSVYHYGLKANDNVRIKVLESRFDVSNAERLMADVDIVVDCSDNFETRYLINDTAVLLGKPLVYGSVLGFEGQFTVFNYQGGWQLRDLFPEQPAEVQDCDAKGVLGPLPGVIGSMMAMEVLKIILGLEVFTNRFYILNSLSWKNTILEFG